MWHLIQKVVIAGLLLIADARKQRKHRIAAILAIYLNIVPMDHSILPTDDSKERKKYKKRKERRKEAGCRRMDEKNADLRVNRT